MSVTVIPLGGFGEIGRNCLALDIDGQILLLDFGFHLERYLHAQEKFPNKNPSLNALRKSEALPDLTKLKGRKRDVVGIICSHAHLDHIGAIPYLANKFACKIHATAFTASVIRSLALSKYKSVHIETHPSKSSFNISGINVDFIPVAHSTPGAVSIAIHTSAGVLIYANDFKLDGTPVLGNATNLDDFKEYKGKTKALFLDCLYSSKEGHCESEETTRKELLDLDLSNYRAIFATTFSSHIARLKTLCDLAKQTNRKIVFVGSSLNRYLTAAKDSQLIDLLKQGKMLKSRYQLVDFFKKLNNPQDYFFIVTGHQGEPNAVLSKLTDGTFKFNNKDLVLFSNTVIPAEICIQHRNQLEHRLNELKVNIIKDIHVSGHLFVDDHKTVVNLIKPQFVIPSHGDKIMMDSMVRSLKGQNMLELKVGDKFTF